MFLSKKIAMVQIIAVQNLKILSLQDGFMIVSIRLLKTIIV